jgi:hypothetical protein
MSKLETLKTNLKAHPELTLNHYNGRYRIHNGLINDFHGGNEAFTGTITECLVWLRGYWFAKSRHYRTATKDGVRYFVRGPNREIELIGTLLQARRVASDMSEEMGTEDVSIWYRYFTQYVMVEPLMDYKNEGMVVADVYDYPMLLNDTAADGL